MRNIIIILGLRDSLHIWLNFSFNFNESQSMPKVKESITSMVSFPNRSFSPTSKESFPSIGLSMYLFSRSMQSQICACISFNFLGEKTGLIRWRSILHLSPVANNMCSSSGSSHLSARLKLNSWSWKYLKSSTRTADTSCGSFIISWGLRKTKMPPKGSSCSALYVELIIFLVLWSQPEKQFICVAQEWNWY